MFVDRGKLPPKEVKPRAALLSQVAKRQGKLVAKVDRLLDWILKIAYLVVKPDTSGEWKWVGVYD